MGNRLHNPENSQCEGCLNLEIRDYDKLLDTCGFCKRNGFMQEPELSDAEDKYVTAKDKIYAVAYYGETSPWCVRDKLTKKEAEQQKEALLKAGVSYAVIFQEYQPDDEANYAVTYHSKEKGWGFKDGYSSESAHKLRDEMKNNPDIDFVSAAQLLQ